MTRYLFVDRDGTLIEEPADFQIDTIDKFSLLPGVVAALSKLQAAGYKLVMITNQDGLGTKSNPQAAFDMMQNLLLKILFSQGIRFEEVLICPHLPNENCPCRKPKTQLVKSYLASNEMDRENSYVIGDRLTDLELAQNMGLQGFKLGAQELNWSQIAHQILDRPRSAKVKRQTKETDIQVEVDLDSEGAQEIRTGLGFFDHMLEQISRHGGFALKIKGEGDLHIDDHHLIEDVALALGNALRQALGDKRGIGRYGFWLPMDEADCRATIDLSGRAQFVLRGEIPASAVGGLNREMVPHFFKSLADSLLMSLHIEVRGENSHHIVESMFKATGRALRAAFARDQYQSIPSSKGVL